MEPNAIEQQEWYDQLLQWKIHKHRDYTYDQMGTAMLMADLMKPTVRFCPNDKKWYLWENRKWVVSNESIIYDKVQTILNLMLEYAKNIEDSEECKKDYVRHVKSLRNAKSIYGLIQLLRPNLLMEMNTMNSNPYLLNTPKCAYDLKTGRLLTEEEVKEKNVTKCTNGNRLEVGEEPFERWYTFIDEIMSHDKDKALFLQKALGYSILGDNREECMFIAYGASTRNGKGTLFSSIEYALGEDYADSTNPKLITEPKHGHAPDLNAPQPALCKLIGTRLVSMSEAPEGSLLDSACVKSMTGRDKLSTRGLYEGTFTFLPQFTLWLNTNWLPAVNDETIFASDRMWIITFEEHFGRDTQDRDLKNLFREQKAADTILEWLYQGCQMYLEDGHLNPPPCVVRATERYHQRYDKIGCFLEESTERVQGENTTRGNLYNAYTNWCSEPSNRYRPVGSTTFYNDIERRGIAAHRLSSGWVFKDIKLKDRASAPDNKIKLVR